MWRIISNYKWRKTWQCRRIFQQSQQSVCRTSFTPCHNEASLCIGGIQTSVSKNICTVFSDFRQIISPRNVIPKYSGLIWSNNKDFIRHFHQIRQIHVTVSAEQNILNTFKAFELSPLCNINARCISKKSYQFPEIKEEELDEQNVRGWGRGGQAVNKTNNCVVLKHKPTGFVIKCHSHRSLIQNRKEARERLQLKLDKHINGENCFVEQLRRENLKKSIKYEIKAKKKRELKKQLKERLENEE